MARCARREAGRRKPRCGEARQQIGTLERPADRLQASPRQAQASPGKPPGKPRPAQASPGKRRQAQASPGEPRRAQASGHAGSHTSNLSPPNQPGPTTKWASGQAWIRVSLRAQACARAHASDSTLPACVRTCARALAHARARVP